MGEMAGPEKIHWDDRRACESATVYNDAGVLRCTEHQRPVRGVGWLVSPDAVARPGGLWIWDERGREIYPGGPLRRAWRRLRTWRKPPLEVSWDERGIVSFRAGERR